MNKKGVLFLSKKVANILIAILVILVLFYFAMQIWNAFLPEEEDIVKAEAHLENIYEKISSLIENGGGDEIYHLSSPSGWTLVAWPNDEFETIPGEVPIINSYGDVVPDFCEGKGWEKCLCFCKVNLGDTLGSCNEENVCKDISNFNVVVNPNPDHTPSLNLAVGQNGKNIKISLSEDNLRISNHEV